MSTKHRSIIGITFLEIITFGIYKFYWYFITKTELNVVNGKSVKIPFFLWFFVPIINIWWFWRFAKSIEKITSGSVSRWSAFIAPVVLNFASAIFLVIIYGPLGFGKTFTVPWFVSLIVATIMLLLPIYYYQSNLNKYAK